MVRAIRWNSGGRDWILSAGGILAAGFPVRGREGTPEASTDHEIPWGRPDGGAGGPGGKWWEPNDTVSDEPGLGPPGLENGSDTPSTALNRAGIGFLIKGDGARVDWTNNCP